MTAPDAPETTPADAPAQGVPARDATAEDAARSEDGEQEDAAWDPNEPASAEYRAALTKNLSLELAKSHGRGRIRAITTLAVAAFVVLMAAFAYRLVTQKMALREAEEKAPPPPSGAVYKAPPPSRPRGHASSDAAP